MSFCTVRVFIWADILRFSVCLFFVLSSLLPGCLFLRDYPVELENCYLRRHPVVVHSVCSPGPSLLRAKGLPSLLVGAHLNSPDVTASKSLLSPASPHPVLNRLRLLPSMTL